MARSNPIPRLTPLLRAATRIHVDVWSGVLLFVAACIALLMANSPWRHAYESFFDTPLGSPRVDAWLHDCDLHFLINDGLMTLFFFVVGLEIRREAHDGALRDRAHALLPILAAAGGMVIPALFYVALNLAHEGSVGWGIPMATDIAFAAGVLSVLGRRVPSALRVLLLAIAVADDIGAIAVIAFFYSTAISITGFAIAAGGVLAVLALRKLRATSPWAYVIPGVIVWAGALRAGIHPTLAGVVMGLLTPIAWRGASPATELHRALHPYVSLAVMPLFALANAGVSFGGLDTREESLRVCIGVTLGLAIGKPIGVLGSIWMASRAGLVRIPTSLGQRDLAVLGACCGIGFTMAIFLAQLAFPPGALRESAKVGVLVGSALAALLSVALHAIRRNSPDR